MANLKRFSPSLSFPSPHWPSFPPYLTRTKYTIHPFSAQKFAHFRILFFWFTRRGNCISAIPFLLDFSLRILPAYKGFSAFQRAFKVALLNYRPIRVQLTCRHFLSLDLCLPNFNKSFIFYPKVKMYKWQNLVGWNKIFEVW